MGPNTHTAATIHKEVLTSPPTHPRPPTQPPKRGYPGAVGCGGQNPKNHWRIIFGTKMMILQGVRRQKPYVGVCYANGPKRGGLTTPAPTLDATTCQQKAISALFKTVNTINCSILPIAYSMYLSSDGQWKAMSAPLKFMHPVTPLFTRWI